MPWWLTRREDILSLASRRDAVYVYDAATIRRQAASLMSLDAVDRVLFAVKANSNAAILRLLDEQGVGFECVSPWEIDQLHTVLPHIDPASILFTPNFAPRADYERGRDAGACITLDNLYPLRAWPELFTGLDVFIRVDPNLGRGHHDHVITAGEQSKFGIPLFELDELERLVAACGCRVVGVHAHSGSGIPEADTWGRLATTLADAAARFPEAGILDLGGGIGVPSREHEAAFDLDAMNRALLEAREQHPGYRLWLEPGRYLVAEAGVLLVRVTQVKSKGTRRYVGVTAGMNALIRPALYGAYHRIVNLTRYGEPDAGPATVVGPICETGDTLGRDRPLPECREGDVLLVLNAGAYGRVMASTYNMRPIPEEAWLEARDSGT